MRNLDEFFLKFLRITTLYVLLTCCFGNVSWAREVVVQELLERKVTIQVEDQKVKSVLGLIEKAANVRFSYSPQIVHSNRRVSLQLADATLGEVLEKLMESLQITYAITGNQIILKKLVHHSSGQEPSEDSRRDHSYQPVDETVADQQVKGVVKDENGQQLPGVSILIKGTTRGTTSDSDGNYTITIEDNPSLVLVFSFVGMQTREEQVQGRSVLNMVLSATPMALNEAVVVGYAEQKKSNVTGSIVSVKAGDIAKTQSSSFESALQGKVPGVYVSSNGGQPGGGVSVRIRGIGTINNSNPLYIIDGVQVSAGNSENSNPMASINPADIETIDILKDAASCAIYGTRAANGVVLITTKRGKTGAPKLSVSGYYGVQTPTRKIVEPMNATQYAEYMNRSFTAAGRPLPFPNPAALGKGTDWLDEVIDPGKIQEYQLSVSGGSGKTKYFVSANYFRNDGMMLRSWFERMSVRANMDHQISDKFRIGNSLSIARINARDNGTGTRGRVASGSFASLYPALPIIPVYDTKGNFAGPVDNQFEGAINPVFTQLWPKIDNVAYNVLGNLYAEFEPLKKLVFRTSISTNIATSSTYNFSPIYTLGILNSGGLSTLNVGSSLNEQWIWENTVSYTKSFGNHTLVGLLGTSAIDSKGRTAAQTGQYDTDAFREITSQGAKTFNSTTTSGEESLASVFARVGYDFKNKYLLTVNVRRDGSSKFGPNRKYGVFPSVSGGWRISEEHFFSNKNVVSDLKIRGGWGQVGSDAIGNFLYLPRVVTGANYAFGNQQATTWIGASLADLGNPDIQWETVTEYNFGVDAGLFNNQLTVSAEYFNRTRSNMLLTLNLPGVTGLSTITKNAGNLTNKGFEFGASYRNGGDSQIRYSLNANLTTFNNKVVSLGQKRDIFTLSQEGGGGVSLIREGEPLGVFYGFVSEGLYQSQEQVNAANAVDGNAATPYQAIGTAPGDFKYKDINGDGVINNSDRTIIGNPTPKFTYGFGGDASYKSFDLSLQFFGMYGNQLYNLARPGLEGSARSYNRSAKAVNAWSGPGTSNTIPRPIVTDPNQNFRAASHMVESGSFLRLKNIQLGYTLPGSGLQRLGVSSVRIYLSAQNLFVLTKFSAGDPEVGLDDNNSATAGIFNDLYPQAKTVSMGVKLDF